MYCAYQDRRDLEDDLYLEDEGDSDASEANSELEFHLYSQLHYSSNAAALEEQEDGGEVAPPPKGRDSQQPEGPEETANVDGEREHTGESRSPSPDVNNLLQLLRKKKKKEEEKKTREKLNKQKTVNPKGTRSFSSFIEEVIVIDSSPDVISISEDDTGDDEGVCTLKGRCLPRQQTSTPAQQGSKKWNLSELVTVDSSTSESSDSSDSSDSSESSDSEVLENWMMLGPGRQDGDQSISLNLKGASDSNEDAEEEEEEEESVWLVSTKDKESRICNRDKGSGATPLRVPNRYYTNKNVRCRNCDKNGHISSNCPEPKKPPPCYLCGDFSHMVYACPKRHCKNCGLPGHFHSSCIEKAPWKKRCQRCGIMGHLDDACPEIWRQYHMTTEKGLPRRQRREDPGLTQQVYCYNCSKRHFGHVCTYKAAFNGTYPISTFINYYDVKKDIEERNKRIVLKVAELKRNGIFLTTCYQTPPTPEPPHKKQKVGHHNNYHHHHYHHHHRPNHTPRQSAKKNNHTFFNDSDFVKPAAPKAKRNNKHKQKESHVKPWKPKRAVPASKDRPPAAKLIIDEAKDFPRGGGKGEGAERKRKRPSRRKKAPSVPPEAAAGSQGSASWQPKEKGNRKRRARKNGAKNSAAQVYPTDENLFIIKQRKSKK
ncbi:zinc finger CCHC domain-containing protein 7 [Clinocottus analis]|uniref:zinc finger CCHC domain-containing protein 7 n=1 Tax=Clinocottus analis TaxID=304258 RepID=UPI0035C0BCF1